jgi:hypothetical protein
LSINTDFCTKCNIVEYHSECRAGKETGYCVWKLKVMILLTREHAELFDRKLFWIHLLLLIFTTIYPFMWIKLYHQSRLKITITTILFNFHKFNFVQIKNNVTLYHTSVCRYWWLPRKTSINNNMMMIIITEYNLNNKFCKNIIIKFWHFTY